MQRACAILLPVACPALQYFFTLSHKRHDFGNKLLNIKCVLNFLIKKFSGAFLILRRNEQDMMVNVY